MQAVLQDEIRVSAISARNMVEEARSIHGLSRVATAALGRQMMATAMMAAQLKHESESLTTIIRGDGSLGNLVATGRYGAKIKAYVHSPHVELPPTAAGKLDVGGAVGHHGRLTVVRDLHMREPYTGECNLISGEIAEDFAQYFTASEQTNSLVYLGVHVDVETIRVNAAGGMIVQPLPGCSDAAVEELYARAADIALLAGRLERGETLEAAVCDIFHSMGPKVLNSIEPRWECDCSRERTERALIALGREELQDMIDTDGGAELTCQFCNRAYAFSKEELISLLQQAQS